MCIVQLSQLNHNHAYRTGTSRFGRNLFRMLYSPFARDRVSFETTQSPLTPFANMHDLVHRLLRSYPFSAAAHLTFSDSTYSNP